MFRNMTVGKKIILGFSVVLILLLAVGIAAYEGLTTASDGFTSYREMARDTNLIGRLQANMLMVRLNVKDFIITGKEHDSKQFDEYWKKLEGFQAEAQKKILDPDRANKIDSVETALGQYKPAFAKVVNYMNQRDRYMNEVLNIKGPLMEKTMTNILYSAEKDDHVTVALHAGLAMRHLLLGRLYVVKFLDNNDQKAVDRVHAEFKNMQERIQMLDSELKNPESREMLATIVENKATYTKTFDDLVKAIFARNAVIKDTLDRIGPEIAQNVEDVKLDIKGVQDKLGPALMASNSRTILTISVVGIVALLIGIFLAFIITRGITKPLSRVIEGLNEGSEQVASASVQVSSASQSLAEGASEQAASIEETSSSLEEMSSMTKQNADHAREANNLMNEANQVVKQANSSMSELTTSMGAISKAGEETSKIIKTIDEIAFQTNLLALNAAVEAARAGEAGAGFAVVADEVRNLAMRAAEAAKNTADLIEGTVKKVKDGSGLVTRTNDAFSEVAESVTKVGELVGEIAAASTEQAQGIDQVNKAVAEMDKVVQQNASNAEESASASEEMNSQAAELKGMVNQLVAMVGGTAEEKKGSSRHNTHLSEENFHNTHTILRKKPRGKETADHNARELRPEQVIPMDDEDFKDF
jgi:methyl-accepting chemotaxis protein